MDGSPLGLKRDIRVIGVVGAAHGGSHFFHLVLPPLFPWLREAFDVSYTELALVMTVFFAVSALAQAAAGFVVDRIGAAKVLTFGLASLGVGAVLIAMAPGYWALPPAAILLGLGNSVFHPADYAILNHHITPNRMARAFSVHTVGGTLGWALAPLVMASSAALVSWRFALVLAAVIALLLTLLVLFSRRQLETPKQQRNTDAADRRQQRGALIGLFLSGPILLCFAYFALQASGFLAVQSFMPLALHELFGTPMVIATGTITAFMLGSAMGTLVGGVIADASGRFQLMIAIGLALSACCLLLVGYVPMEPALLFGVLAIAGSLQGTTTPARDMLVRSATPPGSTGKVFGFVYSGLDLGATIMPLVMGWLLDHGHAQAFFPLVAAVTLLTILTATSIPNRRGTAPAAAE
ncbi:MAG TPA: MFS transporter [Geminicoccaceae bacterium]|jgi:MFS family permease|nr:MFS transporter [Geminicoccaceae bacterium]